MKAGKYSSKVGYLHNLVYFAEYTQVSLYPFLRKCGGLVGGDFHISLTQRIFICLIANENAFSALTLLVGRQEGHPAFKNRVVGCWCGCLSEARCRLAYVPADATATHCLLLQ